MFNRDFNIILLKLSAFEKMRPGYIDNFEASELMELEEPIKKLSKLMASKETLSNADEATLINLYGSLEEKFENRFPKNQNTCNLF